jgi:hypothetical protein
MIPPLVKCIQDALVQFGTQQMTIRVSVSRETAWEKSKAGDGEVLVRWLCWSIEDKEEVEVVRPNFAVLSDKITEEQLRKELPAFFPSSIVIVNDDIEV